MRTPRSSLLSGEDSAHIEHLAEMVDARMRAVAAQGRTVDSLRVAVLAALNLADELSRAVQSGGADACPDEACIGLDLADLA